MLPTANVFQQTQPAILSQMVKFAWYLIKVVTVAAIVLAAIGGVYAVMRLDDGIRLCAEEMLTRHLAPLRVSVRSARRADGKGIVLRGISVAWPSSHQRAGQMLAIDEMLIGCSTRIDDLVRARPEIKHIAIRGMTLTVTQLEDGSYDVLELLHFSPLTDSVPSISIEDVTLVFYNSIPDGPDPFTAENLKMSIVHAQQSDRSSSAGWELNGSAAANYFRHAEWAARWVPGGGWAVRGKVEGLNVSPELRGALPREMVKQFRPLGSLRGQGEFDFELASSPRLDQPLRFSVIGEISRGYLDDPHLPFPLTDLRAGVHCDQDGLRIEQFVAHSGSATLQLEMHRHGHAPDSPLQLSAEAHDLQLDEKLANVLPPHARDIWSQFSPEGSVNASARLDFDGKHWKPDLLVECLDVSFQCQKVPYPLQAGTGTLHLKDNVLSIDMKARASGQLVELKGSLRNPGPTESGWIDARSKDPIPINPTLMDALKPKLRKVVQSLHARGSFHFHSRIEKTGQAGSTPRHTLEITLQRCSVNYEKFPYPLENVRGVLKMVDGQWSFRNLEASNDSGDVRGEGGWQPTPDGGRLRMDFIATDIPLEEELRDALTPNARKFWKSLRPQGAIDHLLIELTAWPARKKKSLTLVAQKWPRQQNGEGRGVAVIPTWFPYRLEEVTGRVEYHDGHVQWKKLRAHHNGVQLAFGGDCLIEPNGPWKLQLKQFHADRVHAGRDLITALPSGLSYAVSRLNPSQPVNVRGNMNFQGNRSMPVTADWDLEVDLAGGGIDVGTGLNHVQGGLQLQGTYDGKSFQSRGELLVDSLIYGNIQVTDVRGPIWIDNRHVLLGSRAEGNVPGQLPRQVTANTLGGTLYGNGQVLLADDMQFSLYASLTGGDLAQIAREMKLQERNLSGKAFALLQLSGSTKGTHTLRGSGSVRLRDADIYTLPVMVSMLKIIRIRPPDQTAFTDSQIDFQVEGEHINLRRVDFHGDAISLKGDGWINLDREINLNFYTNVVRDDKYHIPVVSPLLGEASRQFMLIRVTGTFDDPKTEREALPGLNETFQQLFPEANQQQEENTSRSRWNPSKFNMSRQDRNRSGR